MAGMEAEEWNFVQILCPFHFVRCKRVVEDDDSRLIRILRREEPLLFPFLLSLYNDRARLIGGEFS